MKTQTFKPITTASHIKNLAGHTALAHFLHQVGNFIGRWGEMPCTEKMVYWYKDQTVVIFDVRYGTGYKVQSVKSNEVSWYQNVRARRIQEKTQ